MQNTPTPNALRAALRFLVTSDVPSEHKAVLIETVREALRSEEAAQASQRAEEQDARTWRDEETLQLQSLLAGKVAKSWQHADELLMHAAACLHRSPDHVRARAGELGLGEAVDYRLARSRATKE